MDWIEQAVNGVLLRIKIQPKASKNQIVGLYGEPPRLKLRIAAPPIDGRANEELTRFLAEQLGIAYSKVELVRGETSSSKDVFCAGVSLERIKTFMASYIVHDA